MKLTHGFKASELFYDDVNFPHGFRKSGDFNIADADLLVNIGKRLFILENALCKPENQVEEQFVQLCSSHIEGQTKVELLWQKYKTLTKVKPLYSLAGPI
ncbi:MAG: DUF413 domain-containing protein [Alteromonadaceae bacterium]|jgi:uncharacterized protein YifE (UPF0438 family)